MFSLKKKRRPLCDVMEVLADDIVVIILQCTSVSNLRVVRLKLTQFISVKNLHNLHFRKKRDLHKSYISQKSWREMWIACQIAYSVQLAVLDTVVRGWGPTQALLCVCRRKADCEWWSWQESAISTNMFPVGRICLLLDSKMSICDYWVIIGGMDSC